MRRNGQARDVYINGRFLTQRVSGVQRFAREVVKALDAELGAEHRQRGQRTWTLLVPRGTKLPLQLSRIGVRAIGARSGHLWDQLVLPQAARDGILVNLTNGAPFMHPRSIVILHDAAVYRTPGNFTPLYTLVHRALGQLLARRARLGTVSEFSKRELADILRVDRSEIFVVPNSCEHLRSLASDDSVVQRLGLGAGRYFLFVGKPSPNKNLPAAMAAFGRLQRPELKFVIVGEAEAHVFRRGMGAAREGVITTGYLTDAELVGLLRSATALVFPSLYEGFGIPPLEGMVAACPVLAARIPAVLEVCGDAALYFDPTDVSSIEQAMRTIMHSPDLRTTLIERGNVRARMYSWQDSAVRLIDAVEKVA